eukprot:TRINITY_DN12461_c0_g1::TRINITY_DN12461_c0_g1_i1::g.15067::m.15067 TRINITY_DN12461_c0_g1::TRINITY_DN12461_c0_g1_i1::g.15067  ORF type:complete len:345 (-),score=39.17,sp/Q7T3C7/RT4I1_DANRE/32.42/2e-46,ADH_zinc_N_2/PF13602.1/4.8e-23,ADH_zinc_N/PF00107.21/1.2e-13,ADH_zinc_N/PF00107.21/9.2e+03,ADH_N/PF08240.7/4.9e-06,ADH_N/PF08240.7/4.2e+02 TRINITY_DN12461_c0_g1_i1:119-1153(-)
MKVVAFSQCGSPDVLRIEEMPIPHRKLGDVLVRVHAISINPVDFKQRRGDIPSFIYRKPKIVGSDFSGTIEDCDSSSRFSKGDQVYGHVSVLGQYGCCAEFLVLPEAHVAHIPMGLSLTEAAALPLVALTTYQALVQKGRFTESDGEGKTILVHAGSGGLGSFAVQFCKKYLGFHVISTCGSRNVDLVKSLGADEVIDYRTQDFAQVIPQFSLDAVFDSIGGPTEMKSLALVKPDSGMLISILASGWQDAHGMLGNVLYMPAWIAWRYAMSKVTGPRYTVIGVVPNGKQLEHIAKIVHACHIKPLIDRVYQGLSEVAEAHAYMEEGHATGKVIVLIHPEDNVEQ